MHNLKTQVNAGLFKAATQVDFNHAAFVQSIPLQMQFVQMQFLIRYKN